MEEITALKVYAPPIAEEQIPNLGEAIHCAKEAAQKLMKSLYEKLVPTVQAACKAWKIFYEAVLYVVASEKEWHLMKYSKKRRIRKKYRDRLSRRLSEKLKEIKEEITERGGDNGGE